MSGAFYLLNASFSRVMILFVDIIFFSAYSIIAKKFDHTPHKLFLGIVGPDVNINVMLAETVLKYFGNVQS